MVRPSLVWACWVGRLVILKRIGFLKVRSPLKMCTDIQNPKADLRSYLLPQPNLVPGTHLLADITQLQFRKNRQVGNVSDLLS